MKDLNMINSALAASPLTGQPLPLPHTTTSAGTTPEVDADLVTPGLFGFLTLFLSAVAVYFLARSMARRVQRVNHRSVPTDNPATAPEEHSRATADEPAESSDGPRDGERGDKPSATETTSKGEEATTPDTPR